MREMAIELAANSADGLLHLDNIPFKSHDGGMKIKTSVTLSEELVHEIDAYSDRFKNRSVFLETAARYYITQLRRAGQDARDVEIIDQWADDLNEEVLDALGTLAIALELDVVA